MKTIEEKAKAYDEIIERAKTMLAAGEVMYGKENNASQLIIDIIPELRESDDERIRKVLVSIVKWLGFDSSFFTANSVTKSEVLAYLERQKEQKPISSCNIVPYIDDKIAALQDMWREEKVAFDWDDMHEMIEDVARQFYQKEQNPAWSEEDEKMLNGIIGRGCSQIPYTEPGLRGEQIDWLKNKLKFLRPKPHWEPSDEQMKALDKAIPVCAGVAGKDEISPLISLYEQLKKLCK